MYLSTHLSLYFYLVILTSCIRVYICLCIFSSSYLNHVFGFTFVFVYLSRHAYLYHVFDFAFVYVPRHTYIMYLSLYIYLVVFISCICLYICLCLCEKTIHIDEILPESSTLVRKLVRSLTKNGKNAK